MLITGANPTTVIFAPYLPYNLPYLTILLQDTADGPMTLEGYPRGERYAMLDSIFTELKMDFHSPLYIYWSDITYFITCNKNTFSPLFVDQLESQIAPFTHSRINIKSAANKTSWFFLDVTDSRMSVTHLLTCCG